MESDSLRSGGKKGLQLITASRTCLPCSVTNAAKKEGKQESFFQSRKSGVAKSRSAAAAVVVNWGINI